jgi:Spy/CpxP family protein refolding chaperone
MKRFTLLETVLFIVVAFMSAFLISNGVRPKVVLPATQAPVAADQPFRTLLQMDKLSPKTKREIRQIVKAQLPRLRAATKETRSTTRAFHRALTRENIDEQQVRKAAQQAAKAQEQKWLITAEIGMAVMEALPLEARQEFVKRRQKALRTELGEKRGLDTLDW